MLTMLFILLMQIMLQVLLLQMLILLMVLILIIILLLMLLALNGILAVIVISNPDPCPDNEHFENDDKLVLQYYFP